MTERIYENPESSNEFVEVSSAVHKEIVNYAMENDLTLGVAAGEYLNDLLGTSPDEDSDEDSDEE